MPATSSQGGPGLGIDVEPVDPAAPIRLLIVVDGLGATQQISFSKPLETWRAHGAVRLRLIDEKSLERVRVHGERVLRDALAEEFRRLQPTAVILSRYGGPDYPILFRLAREHGAPVVCHLDDDLFEVPICLGAELYRRYRHPRRVHALYRIAEAADVVYASTSALGRRVKERLNPRRLVVAGIYVGGESGEVSQPADDPDGIVHVGYMASLGHAFDLELAAAAIIKVGQQLSRVRFHLFGSICRSAVAQELRSHVTFHDRVSGSYADFRQTLGSLGWHIGLAPLRNHDFNVCKAPTKWLEYTDAGIATLASDHPVYRSIEREGALAASADDDWEQTLAALVSDPERRRRLATRAAQLVRDEYPWSRLEQQVIDLLAQLPPATGVESASVSWSL